jgi:hypothetical protein
MKEAEEVINTVIGSIDLGNGYYVDVTTKKSIEEVSSMLFILICGRGVEPLKQFANIKNIYLTPFHNRVLR